MATEAAPAPYAKRWQALVGISILSFVGFIDFTIVNTILPGIQRDLNATVGQLQWVMNAFTLMLVIFMVTMGRLGDICGRRRVLYVGVVIFSLASLVAGMAQDIGFLIACRFVQGITAAITFTCAASLMTHHFPEEEQGRALGIFMSITGLGLALGPVLGGFFMSVLSWRWAFYVNLPTVALGFLLCWRSVQETPPQSGASIDWLGLALFVPGLGAFITAIMEGDNWGWTSATTLACFAIGVIGLVAFVWIERRASFPIIDFKLLRNRSFLGCVVAAVALGGFIGLDNFLAPLYLQSIRNEVPYIAGLMLLPISGLVVILPPLVGRFTDRLGNMPFIVAGQFLLVTAAATQMTFAADSPIWLTLLGLGLFGFAWGLQQGTTAGGVTAALPRESAGLAIGALYTFWNIGGSLGIALGGLIFEAVDQHHLEATLAARNINLSSAEQDLVRSLLSDPSDAQETLSRLDATLQQEILPLFQEAFMAGYDAAMWYLIATCSVAALLVPLIARRPRAAAA